MTRIYTVKRKSLDDMADLLDGKSEDVVRVIDGGDHMITLWCDDDGRENIFVQGTGENITHLIEA